MRTEKIQVKITGEVIIPDDLLGFFREVDDLIKHNDEVTIIESDDLIQTKFAYGGLLEEGADRFGFIYFPEENTRPKWSIELTASEIAKIAEGEKRTLTLWKRHGGARVLTNGLSRSTGTARSTSLRASPNRRSPRRCARFASAWPSSRLKTRNCAASAAKQPRDENSLPIFGM